jgi:hypothetical protein
VKIELEVWQLITLLIGFFGACAGAGRLLLTQMLRHIDLRFRAQEEARAANHEQVQHRLDRLEESAKVEAGEWQRVEREFLEMQRDMALHYVRREDYIRGQSVVEAKLDGLAMKIENLQLRGVLDGKQNAN